MAGAARAAWSRMLRNAGLVLGERAVFGLVNLAAAAVAVRAVGFEAFGAVVLVHAWARLIGDALRFQSWQAVLRYGAPALAAGDRERLQRLLTLCLRLDLIALAGSLVLAWIAAPYAAELLGWPESTAAAAPWYVLAILFMVSGTPTGLLRLFDRFGILAAQHAINATIRLFGALGVLLLEGSATALIAIWFGAAVISGGWMLWRAVSVARAEGCMPGLGGGWRALGAGFPGFVGFVTATNASTTLATALAHATTLAVGASLGASAAGLYGIARQIADAIAKPAKLLGPIVFPEIGRLRAEGRGRALDGLMLRALAAGTAGAAAIGLALWLGGGPLLTLTFGAEALAARDAMVLAGAASALVVWGFALDPALLAAGRAGTALAIQTVAALIFIGLMAHWLPWGDVARPSVADGLTAVGLALVIQAGFAFAARLAAVWTLRRI